MFKQNLALNDQQWLIGHKPPKNNQPINKQNISKYNFKYLYRVRNNFQNYFFLSPIFCKNAINQNFYD